MYYQEHNIFELRKASHPEGEKHEGHWMILLSARMKELE